MREVGSTPVEAERRSVDATIPTIRFFKDYGESNPHDAPAPPHNVVGVGNKTGSANETNEDPAVALTRQRWQRMRRIALRLQFEKQQKKRCRSGEHVMTDANTIRGRKGVQCRACKNAARRVA